MSCNCSFDSRIFSLSSFKLQKEQGFLFELPLLLNSQ